MGESASVLRWLRILASLGIVLVLVVIVSSAYMRLAQAGLSCADWPACYGNVSHLIEASTTQVVARIAHRLSASTVGIVLFALLAVSLAPRPRLAKQGAIAGLALAVAVALAVIGAVSSGSARATPLPAITLANLGGGFALLALLVWLRQSAVPAEGAPLRPELRMLALFALFALLAVIGQIALGGLVSAKFAALACPDFPLCGAASPPGALVATFDPFTTLDVDATRSIVRPPALAALHAAHRVGAHVVLVLAAILVVALARARWKRSAVAVGLLVIAELALGAGSVLAGLPLVIVLAHNLVAALLLAALVAINYRGRAAAH